MLCRATKKSKGIALVQFLQPPDAEAAMAGLDASIFQGRLLHILPAKPQPGSNSNAPVRPLRHKNVIYTDQYS